MANPFDDESAPFVVLRNDGAQFSLWPAAIDVPPGWAKTFGPASKAECEKWVAAEWTDAVRV
jgi:MbtH protein